MTFVSELINFLLQKVFKVRHTIFTDYQPCIHTHSFYFVFIIFDCCLYGIRPLEAKPKAAVIYCKYPCFGLFYSFQ